MMKKIFIFVLVVMLILSMTACEKAPEEQTASGGTSHTEPESVEKQEPEKEQNQQQNEQQNEQVISENPSAGVVDEEAVVKIKRSVYLEVEKDGTEYVYNLNNGTDMRGWKYYCEYEDFDTSLLKETNQRVTVKCMSYTPNDDIRPYFETEATLLDFPDYIKNDKSKEIIAVKLDANGEIIIMSTQKHILVDKSLGAYFEKYEDDCGGKEIYECITKIEIYSDDSPNDRTVIKDKQIHKDIYQRICAFDENGAEKISSDEDKIYHVDIYTQFTDFDFYFKFEYITKTGLFKLNGFSCIADPEFESYIKSIIS